MHDFQPTTVDQLKAILDELINQSVTVKLAANSILVSFFGEPSDNSAGSLFIDPSWRYENEGRVVLGSYDLQLHDLESRPQEERDREFRRLCAFCGPMIGSTLVGYELEHPSLDIRLKLSGDQVLRKFANSAFDDSEWTLYDDRRRLILIVSPQGINMLPMTDQTNDEGQRAKNEA